jgi:uncharacterized linocin/CFP29 family protein
MQMMNFDSVRNLSTSGQWAGLQLAAAMANGGQLSPMVLRPCIDAPAAQMRAGAVLRRDEWVFFDAEMNSEVRTRLAGIADLVSAGLTRQLPNAMGRTVVSWQMGGDLDDAIVSMDGMARSENDRIDWSQGYLPVPIIHKDFFFSLRDLAASRNGGEPLDTTHLRAAARKVAEMTEHMYFRGGKVFGGLPIYGLTTHPNRITASFGSSQHWTHASKTGEGIYADVRTMIDAAVATGMTGPFRIYVAGNQAGKLDDDYKASGTITTRQRLLQIEGLQAIRTVDKLPAGSVVLVQMTRDVVDLIDGEPFQTVQWEVGGGMGVNFKAFAIQIPRVRVGEGTAKGVVHMS